MPLSNQNPGYPALQVARSLTGSIPGHAVPLDPPHSGLRRPKSDKRFIPGNSKSLLPENDDFESNLDKPANGTIQGDVDPPTPSPSDFEEKEEEELVSSQAVTPKSLFLKATVVGWLLVTTMLL